MTIKNIYLSDPYRDVIKVNAVQNSVFRLHLNNSIVYTQQEVWDKINAVEKFNPDEDEITRIGRWIQSMMSNVDNIVFDTPNSQNMFLNLNSYSNNICGGISAAAVQFFRNYIPGVRQCGGGVEGGNGHSYNCFTGETKGVWDNINKMPFYKDKYISPTLEELQADSKLYTEPLRAYSLSLHYTQVEYDDVVATATLTEETSPQVVDNMYMRMPAGSNFIFPVKSTNIPKTDLGNDVTIYANQIVTIPTGITGAVEMPFRLLQITGTGTVTVDGVQYTLPDDEAALKAVLQETVYYVEKWFNSFVIDSNTGGIVAEFQFNPTTILLLRNNVVDYEITSGAITFERVKTSIPVPTSILSVNKGDSERWTLDLNKFFTANKTLRLPTQHIIWGDRTLLFPPNNDGKFCAMKLFKNYIVGNIMAFTAETPVIDQCFASKLTPTNDSFTGSLELTFTNFDGSNCYYTLDGSTPDATKTLYTAPFTISATTTVKWINIKADYANSHVNSRTITKTG